LRGFCNVKAVTRVAVVGHVEWVDFLHVDGNLTRGSLKDAVRERRNAAGGAVVAAAVLAELGAEVEFFCAVGADDLGDAAIAELQARGITVHAVRRSTPTREVITVLDGGGERTILTMGERLEPRGDDDLDWSRLERADGVYLTAGDSGAVRRSRAAGTLVANPRVGEPLDDPSLMLDALAFSDADGDEVQLADRLSSHSRLMVGTDGGRGGRWWGESEGTWLPVPPPGPIRDSYGCGDSFAGGLTFGLAQGLAPAAAVQIGARCGARMLSSVGAP
jgi:ribokinase